MDGYQSLPPPGACPMIALHTLSSRRLHFPVMYGFISQPNAGECLSDMLCACTCARTCGSQRRIWSIFLYCSLPYSLETGSLDEPETAVSAKRAGHPSLLCLLNNAEAIGTSALPGYQLAVGHSNSDPHARTASVLIY